MKRYFLFLSLILFFACDKEKEDEIILFPKGESSLPGVYEHNNSSATVEHVGGDYYTIDFDSPDLPIFEIKITRVQGPDAMKWIIFSMTNGDCYPHYQTVFAFVIMQDVGLPPHITLQFNGDCIKMGNVNFFGTKPL